MARKVQTLKAEPLQCANGIANIFLLVMAPTAMLVGSHA